MKKGKRTYKQIATQLSSLTLDQSKPSDPKPERSKRQKKPSNLPPPVIKEVEDMDLFLDLSKSNPDISSLISSLEDHIKDHHDIVLRHFLLLILKLFGLEELANLYRETDVQRLDPQEILSKIYAVFEVFEGPFNMPIFNKKAKGNLLRNLAKFFRFFFCESEKLLYKTKVLMSFLSWFKSFSLCKIRLVRLGVLELSQILLKNSLEIYEKLHEEIKRLQALESSEEVKNLRNREEFIEKWLNELFYEVLLPREKDIRIEIREKYLEILEILLMKTQFLNEKTLFSLDSIIFRKEEADFLKNSALSLLFRIYDKEIPRFDDFHDILGDFLNEKDFKNRVFSLAIVGKGRFSASALQLVLNINGKFPDTFDEDSMRKLYKLGFYGTKDVRRKVSMVILQEKFEKIANKNPYEKLMDFMRFLIEIDEENKKFDEKFEPFIEEIHEFLKENFKPEDFFKVLLDKNFMKKALNYKAGFFIFLRLFIEKISVSLESDKEKNQVFLKDFSELFLKNLEVLLNKNKHDSKILLEILRISKFLSEETLSAAENLNSLKNFNKTLGECLGFIKEADFFEEICLLMMFFSKISPQLKEIAEELINSLVKEELETFQGTFAQIYQNLLEIEQLSTKKELFLQITLTLQRISVLFRYFEIPGFEDEEFLEQISMAFDQYVESRNQESEENAGLALGIMGFAHYWRLKDVFQVRIYFKSFFKGLLMKKSLIFARIFIVFLLNFTILFPLESRKH